MSISEHVMNAVNSMHADLDRIYADAKGYSLSDWRVLQQSLVTGSGAAAAAIPIAHLAGIAADVIFLINRMGVCSYGIGAIYAERSQCGNFLEDEDFGIILNLWAGGDENGELFAALSGKAAADMAIKVHTKAGLKMVAKTMCKSAGLLVGAQMGGKMGAKAGAKVGAKFASKLGGKMLSGFVPFLGPVVGGGINLWFITGIADAAERFYGFKCDVGKHL